MRAPITSGLPDNEAVLNPPDIPWDGSGTNEPLVHGIDEVIWEKRLSQGSIEKEDRLIPHG